MPAVKSATDRVGGTHRRRFRGDVGETPNVAQADGRADSGNHKRAAVAKTSRVRLFWNQTRLIPLALMWYETAAWRLTVIEMRSDRGNVV